MANTYVTALFPTDANCNITGAGTLRFAVAQGTDGSTLQLPASVSSLGLTAGQPRFKYPLNYYGTDGFGRAMPGTGSFNAFTPALSFTGTGAVATNGTRAVTISRNAAEAALTPSLGVMVTAQDNVSGASQGLLIQYPGVAP